MIPVVLFFQSTTQKSWRDKLAGVYRFAQSVGWQIQVVNTHGRRAEITEALNLFHPLGCIVDRAMTLAREPVNIFKHIPVVFLDQDPRAASGRHSVLVHDSAACARLAAEELLKAKAASYTYIPWTSPVFWSDQREAAFANTIRSAGGKYIRWTGDFAALPKPCGILCANDLVASRAMSLSRKSGWKIPDELLFVGIDNDELICENVKPQLTSVLPDFEGAGYNVARLLKEILDGEPPRLASYGPITIIRRASSRRLEMTDARVAKALAFIRQHAFDPKLETDAIVREMGCSRRLADLRFRSAVHHSIRDEIHAIRMERACALLSNPNQAIGPIANLCGYDSEPFFKRLFKRTTGLSMRDWRKRQLLRPQPDRFRSRPTYA